MLSIGKLKLSKPYILAPLAGVSSYPFRMLNRKFGAELGFIEMICARSLASTNKKTIEMLETSPDDRPLGIQLVGESDTYILKAMDKLRKIDFDVLDINAACPTRKIVNNGKGACLLKTPEKLQAILKAVVKHSEWPVTVKIRVGWETNEYADEIARYARDAGIDAIFVHGRTKSQGYRGDVDYGAIQRIKKAVDIPVIGSGNVFSGPLAKKMFDETGCDGVAVARGALGNPWIFREIDTYLKTGKELPKPSGNEVADIIAEHFEMTKAFYGEKRCVKIFRKFIIWHTKGFRNIRYLRAKASKVKTPEEVIALITEFRANQTIHEPKTAGRPKVEDFYPATSPTYLEDIG